MQYQNPIEMDVLKGFSWSDIQNQKPHAVGTLLIVRNDLAADIVNNYTESLEVGELIAIKFSKLKEPKRLVGKNELKKQKKSSQIQASNLLTC